MTHKASTSASDLSSINVAWDVGDIIQTFTMESQVGEITFDEYAEGKWCLLVTVGEAFDPVPTTELGMLSRLEMEFESRNIALLVVGHDNLANYRKWIRDIEDIQAVRVGFPLLSDKDCSTIAKLGCAKFNPAKKIMTPTCMGAFLLDLEHRVQVSHRYPFTTGRNWYELLRAYDGLQLTVYKKVLTPAHWGQGQDVVLSQDITKDEASELNFTEIKPYFKLAPCPDL